MKTFFIFVFSIYTVGNLYLFVRGWQSLEMLGAHRIWYALVFWIVAFSYIITQMLWMKGVSGVLLEIYHAIGSYWIVVMLYGFLILLAIDILRIVGWAGNIRPEFVYRDYQLSKIIMFGVVCLVFSIIFTVGYRNAHRLRTTHLTIPIEKKAGQLTGLRVVLVSDIHLGHIYGPTFLERVVDEINKQHPDLVFLAGDIFEGAPAPAIKEEIGAAFERLQTKYGTYMVSGNHEHIGRWQDGNVADTIFAYLSSHGVQPLQDSVVFIDSSFYVAGRKDRSFGTRKTIPELLSNIDRQMPIIMIDHQPYHLDTVEQEGVDLHLSGHTHHGQMWPLNYITQKIYEQDWGYLQKGKSNFYISCGVGTWGPPIRTAGYSEMVVIDLKFN